MNELTLCIVNTGGDYLKRREMARLRIARLSSAEERFSRWAERVRFEADLLRRVFGREFTVEQMAQAVVELDRYYQQHIKEM